MNVHRDPFKYCMLNLTTAETSYPPCHHYTLVFPHTLFYVTRTISADSKIRLLIDDREISRYEPDTAAGEERMTTAGNDSFCRPAPPNGLTRCPASGVVHQGSMPVTTLELVFRLLSVPNGLTFQDPSIHGPPWADISI